jgi:hypothetical protein
MQNFPNPQRMDRVIIAWPNAGEYYGVAGVLIHWNTRTTCLVIPDSNPRVEASVPLEFLVHERYRAELNLAQPKPHPVTVAVKAVSGPSKRGKPRTTVEVSETIGKAAIADYQAGKGGMVFLAAEYNVQPTELSAYFKAQGIELKRGRKAA